jgi:hypothetical protein
VLGKFADLPHEVEAEIRGLDEARRRIAELERQISKLKSSNAAPQVDQAAIERAMRASVERERIAWRRKLERGQSTLPANARRGGLSRASFRETSSVA